MNTLAELGRYRVLAKDSLHNCAIVETGNNCLLMKKQAKQWLYCKLITEGSPFFFPDAIQLDWANFDDSNVKNLVISWKGEYARQGVYDGFFSQNEGMMIWNLETFVCYFDQLVYDHEVNWFQQYAPVSASDIPAEERLIVDHGFMDQFFSVDIQIADQELLIGCLTSYNDNENYQVELSYHQAIREGIYRLSDDALIFQQ